MGRHVLAVHVYVKKESELPIRIWHWKVVGYYTGRTPLRAMGALTILLAIILLIFLGRVVGDVIEKLTTLFWGPPGVREKWGWMLPAAIGLLALATLIQAIRPK